MVFLRLSMYGCPPQYININITHHILIFCLPLKGLSHEHMKFYVISWNAWDDPTFEH